MLIEMQSVTCCGCFLAAKKDYSQEKCFFGANVSRLARKFAMVLLKGLGGTDLFWIRSKTGRRKPLYS